MVVARWGTDQERLPLLLIALLSGCRTVFVPAMDL